MFPREFITSSLRFETPQPVRFAASITSIALLRGTTSLSHVTPRRKFRIYPRSHIGIADFPNDFINLALLSNPRSLEFVNVHLKLLKNVEIRLERSKYPRKVL